VAATLTVADPGVTETLPTARAATVTLTVPVFPSLVAVTVVLPAPTAVMRPAAVTVATCVFPLCHVTARPASAFPCASCGVAVICCVPPIVRFTELGDTATVATGVGGGAVTVTVDVPVFPSLVAVIVAVPGATAVTVPLGATVATPVLLDVHATVRSVSTLPAASFVVAASVPVWPVCNDNVGGATVTDATGTAVTVTTAVPLFPSLAAVIVA
jgi:hypothetical protein